MRRALNWTSALVIGVTWASVAFAQPPAGTTLTCKFTSGPLAGSEKDFSGIPGAMPTMVGAPCTDGIINFGIAVIPAKKNIAGGLDPEQIKLMRETAHSICTTVKEAIGKKTTAEITGEVRAKLGGVLGKITDIGGSMAGSAGQESFEGLTQDATAEALRGDQQCRERIFGKMFDKISLSVD